MKKKTNIRQVIRKIVREEVAMAIHEVISELKQPAQPTQPVQQVSQKNAFTKPKSAGKQYSTNPVLNEVLNETEGGLPGEEEYPTMGGGTYDSSRMNDVVTSQYGNMMNKEMTKGDLIAPGAPEEVKNLFDKDYSGILKASIAKSKGRR